jgi:endonuclease/exonuclease/phosphatase (EEP) superfamily protein YafD
VETALVAIGLLMVTATVIPLVRADAWWVRVFDFPRLQVTVLLILVFTLVLLLREDPSTADNVFFVAVALSMAYQCYRMFPYTRLARVQVQASQHPASDRTIRLLISNVLMENTRSDKLLKLIEEYQPDIVLAVETDRKWESELAQLERAYPFTKKRPQDNTYGMLLYSKLELRDPQVKFLVEDDIPSIHSSVVLRSGTQVQLRCLHPRPPAPQESDSTAERDAELLVVAKELKGKNEPALVAGDLNDVAWSRTNDLFQSISGLLDPRVGRGFFHTFNANWPLIRFPLDHVFSSRHFRLREFKRLPHCGSDHFPVFIELSYEPDAKAEQEMPEAGQEEEQEAREKIEKADAKT